jgi:hypothetical protein
MRLLKLFCKGMIEIGSLVSFFLQYTTLAFRCFCFVGTDHSVLTTSYLTLLSARVYAILTGQLLFTAGTIHAFHLNPNIRDWMMYTRSGRKGGFVCQAIVGCTNPFFSYVLLSLSPSLHLHALNQSTTIKYTTIQYPSSDSCCQALHG